MGFTNSPPIAAIAVQNAPIDAVPYGGQGKAAQTLTSSGPTALLPTPPGGQCYRIHTLAASAGSGLEAGLLTALSTIPFASCSSGLTEYLGGVLVDGAITGVVTGGSGTIQAYITYDIVNLPTIG